MLIQVKYKSPFAYSGMSTIVVTPPAAAALVAVQKPSQEVRPGSFTWTWQSTIPGITTLSPMSNTWNQATIESFWSEITQPVDMFENGSSKVNVWWGKTLKPHFTWRLNLLFNGLNGLLHLTNVSYAWNMLRNTSFILTLLLSFAFCCTRNRFASCPRIRVRGKSRNCMFALATIVMTFAQFKGHLGSSGRCDILFTPIVC